MSTSTTTQIRGRVAYIFQRNPVVDITPITPDDDTMWAAASMTPEQIQLSGTTHPVWVWANLPDATRKRYPRRISYEALQNFSTAIATSAWSSMIGNQHVYAIDLHVTDYEALTTLLSFIERTIGEGNGHIGSVGIQFKTPFYRYYRETQVAKNNVEEESEVPLYGQSPAVYPTPVNNGSTSEAWSAAYARAYNLISQMTLEEKVNVTRGYPGTCTGNTGSVPRLGYAPLCLADAPDGIRGQEFVSAFPAGIHVAATFDRDLQYQYGVALGEEYRGKGINIALGPVAGPLGRVATGGRNWEGLSNDPYLAGAAMGLVTKGMQDSGVIAVPKHYLLNEQEYRRRPSALGEAISSNIDDRTIRELYAWPFMDALKAGAASVMSSYQRVNNSYVSQNSKLLNGILKTELGFEGFVVSDWGGQYTGIASANAGLDITMPSAGYWGGNLTLAVNNGTVSEERVNDMVARQLAAFYYLKQDENYPPPSIHSSTQKQMPVNVQGDHRTLIREIGAAGTVLLKNINNALPLKSPQFLNIYGYDAQTSPSPWMDPSRYGGGYAVNFGWKTLNGTLITGGGSGGATPAYVISPFQAIQDRVISQTPPGNLRWDFYSGNPTAYVNAEACLVFINSYASESFDRVNLTDEFSDNLVNNVAANCSNTIVVVHSAGIRLIEAWIDNPNVTSVLFAGLPGQESGNSLAKVLFGDVSPSGRLPYTIARQESDYGSPEVVNGSVSMDYFPQSDFAEGLYIDYRHFDREGIEPRFEFGFGLSYSEFEYGMTLNVTDMGSNIDEYPNPNVRIVQGGHPQLWDTLFEVSIDITNVGDVYAHEVAQLYVTVPGNESPVRQLRGFERLPLEAGQTKSFVFPLTRRDFSVWDVVAQQWRLQRGSYDIAVGASSRDLRADGLVQIN
ncbi:hypothetical protein PMZ80_010090 [Knufia obscura]|uniref:beta-glucosidase n=1 Tax=Knufia obscura TaxID=1635080 RepID=A0ABR0RA21_9EURO|nr:hypothetical protein PMZ80_010090 [Knufia obscura]